MENNTAIVIEEHEEHEEHQLQELLSAVVADMIEVKNGKMTIDDLIGKWSSNGVC